MSGAIPKYRRNERQERRADDKTQRRKNREYANMQTVAEPLITGCSGKCSGDCTFSVNGERKNAGSGSRPVGNAEKVHRTGTVTPYALFARFGGTCGISLIAKENAACRQTCPQETGINAIPRKKRNGRTAKDFLPSSPAIFRHIARFLRHPRYEAHHSRQTAVRTEKTGLSERTQRPPVAGIASPAACSLSSKRRS